MSAHRGRACGGDGLAPLGLGVKLQMVHHHGCDDDHYRPFPWSGPTRGEDIYSVVAVPGFGVRAMQQPFDISSPAAHHHHHHHQQHHNLSAFKSPGAGAMAATLGFPFTDAQWKELQRQAMIYKYMMASVPVPPDLLLPIAPSHPATAPPPLGGGFKLRFSGGTDPEPGRCRRTDGKKWRCSRDAAPDQKYCERHLHRGRPRSRKPVEHQVNAATVKKTKTTHHHHSLTLPIPTPPLTSDISTPTISSSNGFRTQAYHDHQNQNIMVFHKSGEKATTLDPPPRGLEMMMMKGIAPSDVVLPQWHHQNLNNPHYTDLNCSEEDSDQQGFRFSSAPRGFIDAWSVKNTTISADPELTLGGSSTIEEEMGQIQMGLGLTESSQSTRTHQWMSSGGPLAEVLRPSSLAVATAAGEEASSLSSPVGTAASSPSGVLQKGLVSLSDSSGSSSPTTFAMPLPLQWLNQRPG